MTSVEAADGGGRAAPLGAGPAGAPDARRSTTVDRDRVTLACRDGGEGPGRPIVLIHGWGCDGSFLAPQHEVLSRDRRTVAVDLRGHGGSDAPPGGYDLPHLADDVARQCRDLGLRRPILVGHSMGGNVALACAIRHPDLVEAVVSIDSILYPPAPIRERARELADAIHRLDQAAVLPGILDLFFRPDDDASVRAKFADSFAATPRHALVGTLLGHVADHDLDRWSTGCPCPVAYIGADAPLTERARLLEHYPLMRVEETCGSGHFSPLLVPDQVNALVSNIVGRLAP